MKSDSQSRIGNLRYRKIVAFLEENDLDIRYLLTNIRLKDKLEKKRSVKLYKAVDAIVNNTISNRHSNALRDDLKQITMFKLYRYKNPFEGTPIISSQVKYVNYVITIVKNSFFDYLRWLKIQREDLTETGEVPDYYEDISIVGDVIETVKYIGDIYVESKRKSKRSGIYENAKKDMHNLLRTLNGDTAFEVMGTSHIKVRTNFCVRSKRLKDSLIAITNEMITNNEIEKEMGMMIVNLLENYSPEVSVIE